MAALRAQGLSNVAFTEEFERYQREHHALAVAVEGGDVGAVQRALAAGADPHSVDVLGSPVLHIAAAMGQVEIMRHLLESGVDVDVRDDFLNTALILAANAGVSPPASMETIPTDVTGARAPSGKWATRDGPGDDRRRA